MSKIVEFCDSLILEGANPRIAILTAVTRFRLGGLATRQLWDYYQVSANELPI
jgi:hypothetical protein